MKYFKISAPKIKDLTCPRTQKRSLAMHRWVGKNTKWLKKIMIHDGKFLQLKHLNPNAKGNENSGRNTCFQSSVKIICKTAFPLESNLVNSVVVLKKEEFNSLDENRSNISWKQRFTIEPTFRISSYVPQITL